MKSTKNEQERQQEFAEFIESEQIAPGNQLDELVLNMVRNDLRPAGWKVYGKLTLIKATAGLATLTICPQFGLGFSLQNQFSQALHAATSAAVFYLLCGLIFVILGAALGGLILNRAEIRTLGNGTYLYFAIYSVLAYLILATLGTAAFVLSSWAWVLGALLGNILGFETVVRLRQAKA